MSDLNVRGNGDIHTTAFFSNNLDVTGRRLRSSIVMLIFKLLHLVKISGEILLGPVTELVRLGVGLNPHQLPIY